MADISALPLSILDLATLPENGSATQTLRGSVASAQRAEELGFHRYWFAEHHNIESVLSSAPSVLIAHVAAHTRRIRVGAGGVMLPNHSPLVVAEQFGTLEALYPGRIDLGVGRAPGGDQATAAALRRDPAAAERFPQDVAELRALLGPADPDRRVKAIPGTDANVPIFVLGSSLFGAQMAAQLGLPYAFASHFAPDALDDALQVYRREYQPTSQWPEPYVIAAMNVFGADTTERAEQLFTDNVRRMARGLVKNTPVAKLDDDALLDAPAGHHVRHMLRHSAIGDAARVREAVAAFADHTDADELVIAANIVDVHDRNRSYEIVAEAMGRVGAR